MTEQCHDGSTVDDCGYALYPGVLCSNFIASFQLRFLRSCIVITLLRCCTSLQDHFHVVQHFFISGNVSANEFLSALAFRKRQCTAAVNPSLICRIPGKFLIIVSFECTEIHLRPLRDKNGSLPWIQDLCCLETPLHGTGKQKVSSRIVSSRHSFFQHSYSFRAQCFIRFSKITSFFIGKSRSVPDQGQADLYLIFWPIPHTTLTTSSACAANPSRILPVHSL